jgi:putative ABC transport system substrate-binding protein
MRGLLVPLLLALLALPPIVEAQQQANLPRIGVLALHSPPVLPGEAVVWERMRQLGWIEGKTVTVERRGAAGDLNRIPDLAADLVALNLDVIMISTGASARRALNANSRVPMYVVAGDLQAEVLVLNLARPERNITWVQVLQADLAGKRLGILKEVVPGRTSVGLLMEGRSPTMIKVATAAEDAARAMGLRLHQVLATRPEDFRSLIPKLRTQGARGLLIANSPALFSHIDLITALAAKERLASISDWATWPRAGALVSYGPSPSEISYQWADCVDKMLRIKACRRAGTAADEIRAGHQSQNRQGARPHDPAVAAAAGGSGDPVVDRRVVGTLTLALLAARKPRPAP